MNQNSFLPFPSYTPQQPPSPAAHSSAEGRYNAQWSVPSPTEHWAQWHQQYHSHSPAVVQPLSPQSYVPQGVLQPIFHPSYPQTQHPQLLQQQFPHQQIHSHRPQQSWPIEQHSPPAWPQQYDGPSHNQHRTRPPSQPQLWSQTQIVPYSGPGRGGAPQVPLDGGGGGRNSVVGGRGGNRGGRGNLMGGVRGGTMPRVATKVFALIVGIDVYSDSHIPTLRGCVNDATSMKDLVASHFNVLPEACITSKASKEFVSDTGKRAWFRDPKAQIVVLLNKAATRKEIISNIEEHLIQNKNIPNGSPIILFFAGHGSRLAAPKEWLSNDGATEAICPHDTSATLTAKVVHVIPDRTINVLLHGLAARRGNNVTVILDSCHSGGAARDPQPNVLPQPRYSQVDVPIPANLDDDIIFAYYKGVRGKISIPPGFRYPFMESHILLAACRHDQQARELFAGCGFFTSNLVAKLRKPELSLDETTYVDLHNHLPRLEHQVPQCEGLNKARFLFQNTEPLGVWFSLTAKGGGEFEVPLGSLQGVGRETQFIVQRQASVFRVTPIIMIPCALPDVSSVRVSTTDTKLSPLETKVAVFRWKNDKVTLRVFLQPSCGVLSVRADDRMSFRVLDSKERANIIVGRHSNKLIIERRDTIIQTYASPVIQHSMPGNLERRLPAVFNAIARFNFFLNQDLRAGQLHQVDVKMYRLNGIHGHFTPECQSDLFIPNKSRISHEVIQKKARIPYEKSARYGFAITNDTPYNLFPYLFYFDPTSYEIDPWYIPESRTMTAPLHAGLGPKTIGYGLGGGFPIDFSLSRKENGDYLPFDTGFVKLFVSTVYLDLDWIRQSSPFKHDGVDAGDFRPAAHRNVIPLLSSWTGTITVYDERYFPRMLQQR